MWVTLTFAAAVLSAPTGGADASAVCKAPPPAPGQVVSGPVLHVPSADTLCIAAGPTPETWTPIPLAHPAASRGALMSAAFSENVTCAIGSDGRAPSPLGSWNACSTASTPSPSREVSDDTHGLAIVKAVAVMHGGSVFARWEGGEVVVGLRITGGLGRANGEASCVSAL